MSYDYSENILVQESAGHLLARELGWEVAFAYNTEQLGKDGTFGRTSYREILLTRYFRKALQRLNPWLTSTQLDEAQKKMESRLSTASLMQINEEKYALIRDGIPVTVQRPGGRTEEKRAAVIDFQNPENNHFLAIKELKIHGDLYRRRTDIVGFVNGIPLLFVELKKNTVDVQNAYTDNYTDYLDTIPHLFYYNAFLILSNGLEAKVGTLGSKYEFFHEWKRLSEQEAGSVALETMLRGICKKENFLDLLENFILFDHSGGRTAKILARNHQYLGGNEAVKAYEARKLNNGKLGVFWHTQGSGKSYSMVFLAQKIRRKFAGSPTIVVLTDREELNKQISDTFENCGLLGKTKASQFIATSGEDLVQKLSGNPSFIFTLIQKFNKADPEPIYPDHDILIMSDEAHRSQNGIFADNMTALLPTASRIGFTGTPLLSNDNITARTFGGYISVYDFKRAVEDGATVPLYYENRGDKIADLHNPEISDRILDAIEQADLDVDQQEKLEREFAKEIHLLTAQQRLESIAKDFVGHYSDLWTSGKAMFVCLNKVTCVRMYDLAQKYWAEEIARLEKEIKHATQQEAQELSRKLEWMKETEMAVVISQEQNEIQTFQKWGLDIKTHRQKMEKRELDKEFKDPANPLRVVFVCAMWLTGFDVKCLSCLYLDKPLKAHTLMQTIARANRVAEGKSNGLIVRHDLAAREDGLLTALILVVLLNSPLEHDLVAGIYVAHARRVDRGLPDEMPSAFVYESIDRGLAPLSLITASVLEGKRELDLLADRTKELSLRSGAGLVLVLQLGNVLLNETGVPGPVKHAVRQLTQQRHSLIARLAKNGVLCELGSLVLVVRLGEMPTEQVVKLCAGSLQVFPDHVGVTKHNIGLAVSGEALGL